MKQNEREPKMENYTLVLCPELPVISRILPKAEAKKYLQRAEAQLPGELAYLQMPLDEVMKAINDYNFYRLADYTKPKVPGNARIEKVFEVIYRRFHLTRAQIINYDRSAEVVLARQITAYLLYRCAKVSKKSVGEMVGRNGNGWQCIKRLEGLMFWDTKLRSLVESLMAEVKRTNFDEPVKAI